MTYGPLVISLQGKSLKAPEYSFIQNKNVGGIILFTRNYDNPAQLTALVKDIKNTAKRANKEIFVCVDHEGYRVQRFRKGFTSLPAPKNIGQVYDQDPQRSIDLARKYGYIMAKELKDCGVDLSLAPVVDLDKGNAAISRYGRSFHEDPRICEVLVAAYIDGMQAAGMNATLKHFPGHGADIGDSHICEPVDKRAREEIFADMQPFTNLIRDDKAGAIMPAHIKYLDVDPFNTAGNSHAWLKVILRGILGFKGAIISDCLSMSGAGGETLLDKTIKALNYGDVAVACNQDIDTYNILLQNLERMSLRFSDRDDSCIRELVSPRPSTEAMKKLTDSMFSESWRTFVRQSQISKPLTILNTERQVLKYYRR